MMKKYIWNIRSIKSHQDFNRLQMIHKHHKFRVIAPLKPFKEQIRRVNKKEDWGWSRQVQIKIGRFGTLWRIILDLK